MLDLRRQGEELLTEKIDRVNVVALDVRSDGFRLIQAIFIATNTNGIGIFVGPAIRIVVLIV